MKKRMHSLDWFNVSALFAGLCVALTMNSPQWGVTMFFVLVAVRNAVTAGYVDAQHRLHKEVLEKVQKLQQNKNETP